MRRPNLAIRHAAAACLSWMLAATPLCSIADIEEPVKERVTAEAALTIAVGTTDAARRVLPIALFGDDAPGSVATFRGVCDGTLPGQAGVTYRGTTISRVERDRVIQAGVASGSGQDVERSIDSTGYVRSVYVSRADAFKNSDTNALRHDRPGRVSMQKGGGDFRLTIAPAENRDLDETNIVIGQVLMLDSAEVSPSTSLLREINEVPVRQPKAETSIYLALGKAAGDPRTKVETVYRPLRKISIIDCQTRDHARDTGEMKVR